MTSSLPWLLLVLPLSSALLIALGLRRWSTGSALWATASALATLVLAGWMQGQANLSAPSWVWAQAGEQAIEMGLKIDGLSTGMMLVVTGVGFLVHLFSLSYMREDAGKARYFAGLSLFMFSMTGIVLASNLLMMFIFWELVGLSSYLLIGHWFEKASAADAAKKAFLANRIGDFGFMIGILLLWRLTGNWGFDELHAWAAGHPVVTTSLGVAVLFLFCGAVGKSAQVPLHVWLPDAMEGPTPVSALIHAATMVAAGVYLLARLFLSLGVGHGEHALLHLPAFAPMTIAWVGGVTSLLAALMAVAQDDIKKILAYSTLSQLGYMVMAVGLLAPEAGVFHLFTHAWFKALLFLGAGAVIFACHHEQGIWKMGGLARKLPITTGTFALGTLALCGFPFTAGFFSKEQILESALSAQQPVLFAIAATVAFLTTFYMGRLFFVAFWGKPRSEAAEKAHEVGPLMWVPLALLALLAVAAGYPNVAERFSPLYHHHALNLTSPALWVSLGAFASGAVLAFVLYARAGREPLAEVPGREVLRQKFYFDDLYAKLVGWLQDGLSAIVHFLDELLLGGVVVGGLTRAARGIGQLVNRIQSGSLQHYAALLGMGVIFLILITVFT